MSLMNIKSEKDLHDSTAELADTPVWLYNLKNKNLPVVKKGVMPQLSHWWALGKLSSLTSQCPEPDTEAGMCESTLGSYPAGWLDLCGEVTRWPTNLSSRTHRGITHGISG